MIDQKFFLEQWVKRLNESHLLIIVEGEKDRNALINMNIKNKIFVINKGKPIFEIIEEIKDLNKECLILADFDKKGKILYKNIYNGLTHLGVKINDHFRNELKELKISHIQGLKNQKY